MFSRLICVRSGRSADWSGPSGLLDLIEDQLRGRLEHAYNLTGSPHSACLWRIDTVTDSGAHCAAKVRRVA